MFSSFCVYSHLNRKMIIAFIAHCSCDGGQILLLLNKVRIEVFTVRRSGQLYHKYPLHS